jgi:hypothetical protein
MKLCAALALVCGAVRVNEHHQSEVNKSEGAPECMLDHTSIPAYENFKVYNQGDSDSGLIPKLNVKGGTEFYEIREHTNFFKTSEYSFHRLSEGSDDSSPCGRFHTYWLGRSADLRIGRQGQRKRLIRITSARHGNAFDNIDNQVYYVRGKKKTQTYYTIVRKRVSQLGILQFLLGVPMRGALLAPGKIVTHATRAVRNGKPDIYKIFKGKCKYGGNKPNKEQGCGRQIMTGVGTFGDWGMNWYMGKVNGNTNLEDAVATLQFHSERWGKASIHKKQIFRLGVKSGDVGLIVINAFLADIIRAMELVNMKSGHNFWNMDMR